ncbi:MAG TPA: UTP--glucose-1-phosphate uridylyltransferase GalU [Actinomycetota bacterium]|nr:UTP--glucose-1-phosphate uridylyltransferase GalU [Actinomycetota bacterium]
MPVHKAVIPAAGLGTRFLPATKAQPKEMLPLVDKPAIQYVVEEAVRAGMDDILIITGRGKRSLEDHFDRSTELEAVLDGKGDRTTLESIQAISEMADIHYVRQKQPLGLGHAVMAAEKHVGREPFAVLLGDVVVTEQYTLLEDLTSVYDRYGRSVIAVQEVPREEIRLYGSVLPEPVEENIVRIRDFVEKPAPEVAPSNLASLGRYVLTPEVFEDLRKVQPGTGGEIQLTDAIRSLAQRQAVYAFIYEGKIYDVGRKLDYLRATVELAVDREDLGKEFREFLADFCVRKKLV